MTLLLRFSLGFLLVFMALFLIALVLIQRGRGGGLAGAFGGAGGQSAFGTKAGDVFTRITVIVASCWIVLCILAINVLGTSTSRISPALGGAAVQQVEPEIPATPPADAGGGTGSDPAKPAEGGEAKPAPGDEAAKPPEGEPAKPGEGDAAKPADGKTSKPADGEAAKPADGAAAQPAPPAQEPAEGAATPPADPAQPAAE